MGRLKATLCSHRQHSCQPQHVALPCVGWHPGWQAACARCLTCCTPTPTPCLCALQDGLPAADESLVARALHSSLGPDLSPLVALASEMPRPPPCPAEVEMAQRLQQLRELEEDLMRQYPHGLPVSRALVPVVLLRMLPRTALPWAVAMVGGLHCSCLRPLPA